MCVAVFSYVRNDAAPNVSVVFSVVERRSSQAIVWSVLKPGFDACRLATKVEMKAGGEVKARGEMTGMQVCEMVFER